MPIYTATFCNMDQDAGANPFWHACLLLSRFDEACKKLEVVESWGFYALPPTKPRSTAHKYISRFFNADVFGNHGLLKNELVREMDLGQGLRGATFELTEEKFKALQDKCHQMVSEQNQAIQSIAGFLELPKPEPTEKIRHYDYEKFSPTIYSIEKSLAEIKGREPRLKLFDMNILKKPHTCKIQVLELLAEVLTPEQIARVRGTAQSIPRFSGKMELMYLHSSGPLREHKKKSGAIVHYRDGEDKSVTLHWTIPPQYIETLSGETRDLFKIYDGYTEEVKQLVRKLQVLEWLFLNAELEEKYFPHRAKLVEIIRAHYEVFARIEVKESTAPPATWSASLQWLLSQPRDKEEARIMRHVEDAKALLNRLYFAVVDEWEFSYPAEEKAEVREDESVEALAAYLQEDTKQQLRELLSQAEKYEGRLKALVVR